MLFDKYLLINLYFVFTPGHSVSNVTDSTNFIRTFNLLTFSKCLPQTVDKKSKMEKTGMAVCGGHMSD